jgi:predicted RecA/RadA family phage recombinase
MAVKVRDALNLIRTIKYTHTSATTTDTCYLLNGRVLLAMNSALANAANIYMIGGLMEYASETGVAWTAGDKLYWDDTNKRFTKTSTSNTLCALAAEDKASAAATGQVLLIPTP